MKKRILISGWYGNNNIGDETILLAMLQSFKEQMPEAEFLVFSDDPTWTQNNYNVDSFYQWPKGVTRNLLAIFHPRFWKYIFQLTRIIKRGDLFLLGGGGLLEHDTRFGIIPFWLSKIFLAQLLGKPTVMYAIGAGKSKRKFDKFLIQVAANRTKLITVRDKESKKNLLDFYKINRPKIIFTADQSFFIQFPNKIRQPESLLVKKKVKEQLKIGIVLLPLWSVGVKDKDNKKQQKFNQVIIEAIDLITSGLNAKVILRAESYRDDKKVIDDVYKGLQNKESVFVEDRKVLVEENLKFISQLDVLVSMRLHPLITASIVQTPFVAKVLHPKVANFLLQIKQKNMGLIFDDLSPEKIYKKVEYGLENSAQIKKELKLNVEPLRQKADLNTKLVKELFFD